ncbi:MAG: hypothetical protein DLM67_23390 [Candidatus Nephthysia bennettiae]|uniref:Glycosyltransferase RgtA/B/C/D-like domain-containing protein n=1 Tax=Candidatus Nephthysia bennettiae TaxID=3127016 RepID=A0A934N9X4_9BACT|nr:hypothetical protein [Candidatus Dormibacteraeota bacterium]MBJ7613382.1 hypothetical protein [Candidatus Dormibacteraeota bacterium]PZR86768.1 MAG: hypothetical protein DLM67_23390 [Candidatus Dormibacteraeota bacterium]
MSGQLGYITLYNDARSHLNIARHVTDSLTPGFAQLGSVWLPLPHMLMVPLTMNDFLWHSGIAGSLVGGLCFVFSGVRLFQLVSGWAGSQVAGLCTVGAFVLNANLLYIQSTALTEPVLVAGLIGASYHLANWLRSNRYADLNLGAIYALAATLTRYDGWFYLLVATVVVFAVSWVRSRSWSVGEANGLIFAVVGSYGVILWLLYNAIIFGDPLYFMHSVYSAQSQQETIFKAGKLPTKGNLVVSAEIFGQDVLDVCGWLLVALGAAGWLTWLLFKARGRRARSLALLALLSSPVIFNVIALYLGQSILAVPEIPPHGWFNDRYGIVALPLLAVGAGLLAATAARLWPLPALAVVAAGFLLAAQGRPIVVEDGLQGASHTGTEINDGAAFLKAHYHGGRILADDYLASPMMFASGINLREFITVGYRPYYQNALRAPDSNVEWIVRIYTDDVDRTMREHPERFERFKPVFDGHGRFLIYVRDDQAPPRASVNTPSQPSPDSHLKDLALPALAIRREQG